MMWRKKVRLPTNPEEFDALVLKVMERFKLKDKAHTAVVIATAIRHLPNDNAYTTLEILGGWVVKNLAYGVAKFKGDTFLHEAQIENLKGLIEKEPNNQQAIDELTKAANEGSPQAKAALEKIFESKPLPTNVTTLGSA